MKTVPNKAPVKIIGTGHATARREQEAAQPPAPTPVPAKDVKGIAREAVEKYSKLRIELDSMEADFSANFPEASAEINAIRDFKDNVQKAIDQAKELVRAAGESIGEFIYTPKSSKACYNPDAILKICAETGNASLLLAMAKAGFMKMSLEASAAILFFDMNPELKELVKSTWEERKPLTPSIKTPSL
jgi:hypothetical protein